MPRSPKAAPDEELVREAMDALRRIVRALRLAASDVESRLGITVAQLFILQQLSDGRQWSINELADQVVTDPSTVSGIVRRLVEEKLVRRDRSREDARRAEVSLTPLGEALLARAPNAPQSDLVEALGAIPARRLRALAKELGELARRLGPTDPGLFFEEEHPPPRRTR